MKICKLAAFVTIALLSCSKEPRESSGLVRHTITAGIAGSTKTELAAGNNSQVMWSVGDKVDVWVGETPYEFTSQVSEVAMYSTFEGFAPADMGTWVLVYPKGASSSQSGNTVSATLPPVQTARVNSYDPSAALIFGVSQSSSVTCKHLYSGIRLMFTQSGIRRVSLRGNAGEKIAGDFTFSFSGDGSPSISSGTSETIILNAPDGGTFETGQWYFILCLPTVFSQGITITADNGSEVGFFTTAASTTFTRAIIKNKQDFTIDNWADVSTVGKVHYGPANTICLQAGSSTTVDVTPQLTTARWQRSGLETTADAVVPDGCEVLWGDASASYAAKKLTVSASAAGSSLVAIKKGSTILWSFLVWATASEPASIDLPSGAKLQEPLGGELYFQWGRKDPLRKGFYVENQGNNGLAYSIQHPTQYINGTGEIHDWYANTYTHADASLWEDEGSKTVWDPCPRGWRVPSESFFSYLDEGTDYGFHPLGCLVGNAVLTDYEDYMYYWTSTPAMYGSNCLSDYDDPFGICSEGRSMAMPVRCVKE